VCSFWQEYLINPAVPSWWETITSTPVKNNATEAPLFDFILMTLSMSIRDGSRQAFVSLVCADIWNQLGSLDGASIHPWQIIPWSSWTVACTCLHSICVGGQILKLWQYYQNWSSSASALLLSYAFIFPSPCNAAAMCQCYEASPFKGKTNLRQLMNSWSLRFNLA